jgi:5-methylcytosine-specific restriction endonuclease McrA
VKKFCATCMSIVPTTHNHRRWANGSTRQWRKVRAAVLARDEHRCTHTFRNGTRCTERATEVHHVTDTQLRSVCFKHNQRGG